MGLVNYLYPSGEPLEKDVTIRQLDVFCRVESVILKEFKVIQVTPPFGVNIEKHWFFDEELWWKC